jgi:uncharacterized membrane protein
VCSDALMSTESMAINKEVLSLASITKEIDLAVPVRMGYNRWTLFETFPQFMEGVKEVRQLDDKRLLWRAEIGGQEETWEAEIVEQVPDRKIAWRSVSGTPTAGMVVFEPIDDGHCRIMLTMEYEPQGLTETVGSALGFDGRKVEGDLKRFKELVESQGVETGGYRGQIEGDQVRN